MKNLIFMVICFCAMVTNTSCFAGLNDYPNIAVINFNKAVTVTDDLRFEDASMVTNFVIDALVDCERFQVIEREQLRAITDEHSYNASGLIDISTASNIGKIHGVKYLVCGSVTNLSTKEKILGYGNSNYGKVDNNQHTVIARVDARFIDVETGRIVLTGSGTGASTSTDTAVGFGKKRTNDEYVDSEGYMEVNDNSGYEHTIRIGTVKVSQDQVSMALYKAADELVFGKQGFLKKLERKNKRRK